MLQGEVVPAHWQTVNAVFLALCKLAGGAYVPAMSDETRPTTSRAPRRPACSTDPSRSRDDYGSRLDTLFATGDAFGELWRIDGEALTEMRNGTPEYVNKVHFGYTDGISQPTIIGGPETPAPDHQQPCEPWLVVLQDEALSYYVPDPPLLGRNGSFVAFRVSQQDVVGFEEFLQSHRDVIDPELLAAKICGRWRNGVPLALSPDTDSPPGGIAPERLNDFEKLVKLLRRYIVLGGCNYKMA